MCLVASNITEGSFQLQYHRDISDNAEEGETRAVPISHVQKPDA